MQSVDVIHLVLPQKRKISRGLDDGASQHVFSTAEDFEALDSALGDLQEEIHCL